MRLHNTTRNKIKRRIPELNMVSTADISFMLLVFFLLTTSMSKEEGLPRQLPPMEQENSIPAIDIDRKNVLTIEINDKNVYLINNQQLSDKQIEKNITEFIKNTGKQHILEIKAHNAATYNAYFNLQNIIVCCYRNIRNEEAKKLYKRYMVQCTEEEQQEIRQRIPQNISETFINK